jgi:hypothetical protein
MTVIVSEYFSLNPAVSPSSLIHVFVVRRCVRLPHRGAAGTGRQP